MTIFATSQQKITSAIIEGRKIVNKRRGIFLFSWKAKIDIKGMHADQNRSLQKYLFAY